MQQLQPLTLLDPISDHISGEFPGFLLDLIDDARVEDCADLSPGGYGGDWVGGRVRQIARYLEAGARPRLLRTGAVIPECLLKQDVSGSIRMMIQ